MNQTITSPFGTARTDSTTEPSAAEIESGIHSATVLALHR